VILLVGSLSKMAESGAGGHQLWYDGPFGPDATIWDFWRDLDESAIYVGGTLMPEDGQLRARVSMPRAFHLGYHGSKHH